MRYLWLCAVASVGCSPDLPSITEVVDLRVLAVAAEPPELSFDAPADTPVAFTALVVDPRGGAVDYEFAFCPVESSVACEDYASLHDAAPVEHQAAIEAGRALGAAGTVEHLAGGPVSALPVPSFEMVVPAGVAAYHEALSLYGYGTGSWPSAVFTATAGDDQAVAQKRLVLSLADLATRATRFEGELGIRLCEGAAAEGCLAVPPRAPNTNPVFATIMIARGGDPDTPFVELDPGATLTTGEAVRLLPVFTDASYEPYWVLRNDIESRAVFVEERVEDPSVQWFATGGTLQEGLTWPQVTRTLDTRFEAPDQAGWVTLWLVARDQRGGTAWRELVFEVLE